MVAVRVGIRNLNYNKVNCKVKNEEVGFVGEGLESERIVNLYHVTRHFKDKEAVVQSLIIVVSKNEISKDTV